MDKENTGFGKVTWPEGFIYEGGLNRAGQPQGQGEFHKPGLFAYKGNFRNGVFHGQGQLTLKDGLQFTGSFKNGHIDGPGTADVDGVIYFCEEFTLNTLGSLTFKNATIKWKEGLDQGEVKEGQPFRNGVLTWQGQAWNGPFGDGEGEVRLPMGLTFPRSGIEFV
jgi:hypothetical protein